MPHTSHTPSTQSRGFTLVELLVVIVLIAVLFAMLLPSLNKARDQATILKCAANLRQLGILTTAYTLEFRGWYPISGNFAASNSGMTGGARVQATDGVRAMRWLTQQTKQMQVFGCPTQHDGFAPRQFYAARVKNYNGNSFSGFNFGYSKHVGTYSATDCTKPLNGSARYAKTFELEPWRAGDPTWMASQYNIGYRSDRDIERSKRTPSTIVMWMDMNRLDSSYTSATSHAPGAWGVNWNVGTNFRYVMGQNELTIDGRVMWTEYGSKYWAYTFDGQSGAFYYTGP